MPAYDRLEYRTRPSGNEIDWEQEYITLDRYNRDTVDQYNWAVTKLEDHQKDLKQFREHIDNQETKIRAHKNTLLSIRNKMGSLFHRKEITDVDWFNKIIKNNKEKLDFDIDLIHANDYFSAKAVIEIDGKWRGDASNQKEMIINAIKEAIINNGHRNYEQTHILVDDVIINDLFNDYDLSETKEG